MVRAHQEVIQDNLRVLGEVDALQAKVLYAQEYKARTPGLTRQGRVMLKEARHPLLLQRDTAEKGFQATIPVELELTPQSRFLVLIRGQYRRQDGNFEDAGITLSYGPMRHAAAGGGGE